MKLCMEVFCMFAADIMGANLIIGYGIDSM